ncbi:unnamed protein product [Pieris brassicae]|uniref:Uncharacterized protein n=1 Tax=Pieris brassicae TaxID=7116 RepID=A0A9P0TVU2_PIEBR|nr:unnamed protein product [Pieris brassicae]
MEKSTGDIVLRPITNKQMNIDSTALFPAKLIQGNADCYGDYFNWLNLHSKPPRDLPSGVGGGLGGVTRFIAKG